MQFVNFKIFDGFLHISLTDDGRKLIDECDDTILYDLLEPSLHGGSDDGNVWEIVLPYEIGCLTDSIIISNEVRRSIDGLIIDVGNMWWNPQYMNMDEIAVLKSGELVFEPGD